MADIVFIAITFAFFTICVLYVRWCDIIIGADGVSNARADDSEPVRRTEVEEVAA